MNGIDAVQKTGIAIEATVRITDQAIPKGPDLSPPHDYAQWAPLFALGHWGIEIGLKALLLQANDEPPNWHDLGELFQRLKDKNTEKAEELKDAFTDIVNFYTFDIGRFKNFGTLDDYFREYGNRGLYNDFRYWVRGGNELHHIPLFVHRELLVVLERLCRFGKANITSQRVENSVRWCFVNGIEEHINKCDRCRKDCSKPWLKILNKSFSSPTPYSDKLKGINGKDFDVVENGCLNQVMYFTLGCLKESDDPAVKYFIQTLSDLPAGSVPRLCDVDLEVDERGIVKIRNVEENLGLLTHGIDSRWHAQCIVSPYTRRFAKTKDDAINWLANECTEIVRVSVNGGPHIPMRALSPPSPLHNDRDDCRLGYEITFADDAHGLCEGQRIDVRSDRFPPVLHDGVITKVSGRRVIWGNT